MAEVTTILNFMKVATAAYEEGSPILSNEEYDALERKYGQLLGSVGEVEHHYRMFSLKKHYDKDGEFPLNIFNCVETPKLDGAAVSLLYVAGMFTLALTRGDGIKGRDVTDKLRHLVPMYIGAQNRPVIQVTGEVVAVSTVENSRNYSSGALNLKSIDEFLQRKTDGKMVFVAYGMSQFMPTYLDQLDFLEAAGFNTVLNFEHSEYPKDGVVYRLNSNAEYQKLGHTDKFPRGAFAYKQNQESVITTLLDVIWQTGKSGKVTPIAILEPVLIGDATISRATLNNIAYIEALDLELGCQVELVRAGEIIPKIIGKVE